MSKMMTAIKPADTIENNLAFANRTLVIIFIIYFYINSTLHIAYLIRHI